MTTRNVGDSVGVGDAKYPGWWKIDKVSTTGRKLITVMPDAERGNTARRGVNLPPELVTDEPYDPFSVEFIDPGTVVRFLPSVLERKPDFAGLWVVTSERGDKVTLFRLGGSDSRIPGAHRSMFEVVQLADLADAVLAAVKANA
jgi:hypothetical protein